MYVDVPLDKLPPSHRKAIDDVASRVVCLGVRVAKDMATGRGGSRQQRCAWARAVRRFRWLVVLYLPPPGLPRGQSSCIHGRGPTLESAIGLCDLTVRRYGEHLRRRGQA